jgi:ubiquinone/menaquinone biosynthesis C-methylase UbiE
LTTQAIGIDSSREMLALARVRLDKAGLRHAQVRHGDIYALPVPNAYANLVTIHQVLHYLDEPGRALEEMARILKPDGTAIIVDFAPHDLEALREQHAHRRLGIAAEHMTGWTRKAGLRIVSHEVLPPPWRDGRTGLTVSIWQIVPDAAADTQAQHASLDRVQ